MWNLIPQLLFPEYCLHCSKTGSWLCEKCRNMLEPAQPECYICRKVSGGFKTHKGCIVEGLRHLVALHIGWRYNTVARKILSAYKYKSASQISRMIYELMKTRISFETLSTAQMTGALPIPLHTTKENMRGFNQAELLSKQICLEYGYRDLSGSVLRMRSTQQQARLGKEDRQKNLEGAFGLSESAKTNFMGIDSIVIIDDVFSTGATMLEVARALPASIRVSGLALFRGKPKYSEILKLNN